MAYLTTAVCVSALIVSDALAHSLWHLFRNYLAARKIGLPIRIIPICHTNPLWTLVDKRVIGICKRMPLLKNTIFVRYNYRGWELADGGQSHNAMGPAFVMVSARRNWLYVADPEALVEIFRRRIEFPRCLELTEILNVFGPNISTVDGAQRKAQRKMTATCFNEHNNQIVWGESLFLARDMLHSWAFKKSVTTIAHDTRTLSLHVLSRAGFGKSYKFQGHDERSKTSPSTSYKDSLQMILENCVLIMVLGPRFLNRAWWLPRQLRGLREACSSFQQYMTDLYEGREAGFFARSQASRTVI